MENSKIKLTKTYKYTASIKDLKQETVYAQLLDMAFKQINKSTKIKSIAFFPLEDVALNEFYNAYVEYEEIIDAA